jgi:low affinity Fe/Cu permease
LSRLPYDAFFDADLEGMPESRISAALSRSAHWAAWHSGRAYTFILACLIIVVWAATGPLFGYSDTWQLIINTGTTIVTFLMVFLLQNTQTRDTGAIQLKLDELIRANEKARNAMLDLEHLSEEQLSGLKAAFTRLAAIPATHGASVDLGDEVAGAEPK